jgi:hypothetical protein
MKLLSIKFDSLSMIFVSVLVSLDYGYTEQGVDDFLAGHISDLNYSEMELRPTDFKFFQSLAAPHFDHMRNKFLLLTQKSAKSKTLIDNDLSHSVM